MKTFMRDLFDMFYANIEMSCNSVFPLTLNRHGVKFTEYPAMMRYILYCVFCDIHPFLGKMNWPLNPEFGTNPIVIDIFVLYSNIASCFIIDKLCHGL